MTSKELNESLLNNFPEIQDKFNEEASRQDGIETGSFIIFEDVFMPFVRNSVLNNDKDTIYRIFNYIEYLSHVKDEYVENIFYVAILENFYSYSDINKFVIYFKENTKELFIKNFLNHSKIS